MQTENNTRTASLAPFALLDGALTPAHLTLAPARLPQSLLAFCRSVDRLGASSPSLGTSGFSHPVSKISRQDPKADYSKRSANHSDLASLILIPFGIRRESRPGVTRRHGFSSISRGTKVLGRNSETTVLLGASRGVVTPESAPNDRRGSIPSIKYKIPDCS